MAPQAPHASIQQSVDVLLRQFWLIALVTLLAIGVSVAVNSQKPNVYRASMKVVVGQGGGVFQPEFGNAARPFTQTMTSLLESDVVAATVIKNLKLDTTPEKLLADVQVTTAPESSVLEVELDSQNGPGAVRILNEVGRVFTALVGEKLGPESPLAAEERLPPITATVFDPAHLEAGRVSPRPVRSTFLAGVLGLALGLVFAFLRDSMDDRIRNRRDAEKWFGAPVIGSLPPAMLGKRPSALNGGNGSHGHGVRTATELVRAQLQYAQLGRPSGTIVVTGALPDAGKSTLAANLAVALATAGEDVICVDADLRHPSIGRYVDVGPGAVGLSEVLEKGADLDKALREVELHAAGSNGAGPVGAAPGGRLRVLLPTKPEPNPADLLKPDAIAKLIEELRKRAGFVLFDAPPILAVGDAFPLMLASDQVIIAVRQRRTTKEMGEAVREILDRLGVADASIVLTDAKSRLEALSY
jgi:succinoglycan biosynthesis transport protein ExoP